jgi:hypothetical protein
MISNVRISAYGKNLEEIKKNATKQWRAFVGEPEAELPFDSEFSVREHSEKEYVAEVVIRLRMEK